MSFKPNLHVKRKRRDRARGKRPGAGTWAGPGRAVGGARACGRDGAGVGGEVLRGPAPHVSREWFPVTCGRSASRAPAGAFESGLSAGNGAFRGLGERRGAGSGRVQGEGREAAGVGRVGTPAPQAPRAPLRSPGPGWRLGGGAGGGGTRSQSAQTLCAFLRDRPRRGPAALSASALRRPVPRVSHVLR